MREVVIVIADLYPAPAEARSDTAGSLPGLEHIVRFGRSHSLPAGWRAWVAQWADRADLADAAPASVAAAAVEPIEPTAMAWLATPVHFLASLTRVHLSGQGMLRLPADELERLAADFARTFADTGYQLRPLASGEWLATGPALGPASTTDPARFLGASVEDALPSGPGAAALRRLGAEIEMWLHDHPVNLARERRGEPRISALWWWGGGPALQKGRHESACGKSVGGRVGERSIAFGQDAYVEGLWRLLDAPMRPLPQESAAVLDAPAERALIVLEALRANLHAVRMSDTISPAREPTTADGDPAGNGLQAIDRHWVQPLLQALREGAIEIVTLVANDRRLELRARDRLKIWRRPRAALAGLR